VYTRYSNGPRLMEDGSAFVVVVVLESRTTSRSNKFDGP
jgi:hypothetical protein